MSALENINSSIRSGVTVVRCSGLKKKYQRQKMKRSLHARTIAISRMRRGWRFLVVGATVMRGKLKASIDDCAILARTMRILASRRGVSCCCNSFENDIPLE